MAKKKAASGYDRIDATVSEGRVRFDYRVTGATRDGRTDTDGGEDLSEYTDDQIRELGCDLLGIDHEFANEINVCWD